MDLYEQTKLKIVPITNYLEQKGLLNNEQKSNLSNLFIESDAANVYNLINRFVFGYFINIVNFRFFI